MRRRMRHVHVDEHEIRFSFLYNSRNLSEIRTFDEFCEIVPFKQGFEAHDDRRMVVDGDDAQRHRKE